MSRIAYIGVLVAGAVLTVVALQGSGQEAAASGDYRVCVKAWCPKDRPGRAAPAPRGGDTSTTTSTTTTTTTPYTTTSTYTTSSTTTSTTTSSTTTSSTTTTTPPTSTSTTTTPVTTTPPVTTTTKPPITTPPVTTPPRHDDNRLANTGADVGWLLLLGVLLGVAGVLLLLIDRTRQARC